VESHTGQNLPRGFGAKNLISSLDSDDSLKPDLRSETGNNGLLQTRISVPNSGALESGVILKVCVLKLGNYSIL